MADRRKGNAHQNMDRRKGSALPMPHPGIKNFGRAPLLPIVRTTDIRAESSSSQTPYQPRHVDMLEMIPYRLQMWWETFDSDCKEIFHNKFKRLIQFMNVEPRRDMLEAISMCWDPNEMLYKFGRCEMAPTLAEVSQITGLPYFKKENSEHIPLAMPVKGNKGMKAMFEFFGLKVDRINSRFEKEECIPFDYMYECFGSPKSLALRALEFEDLSDSTWERNRRIAFCMAFMGIILFPRPNRGISLRLHSLARMILDPKVSGEYTLVPMILAEMYKAATKLKTREADCNFFEGSNLILQTWLSEHLLHPDSQEAKLRFNWFKPEYMVQSWIERTGREMPTDIEGWVNFLESRNKHNVTWSIIEPCDTLWNGTEARGFLVLIGLGHICWYRLGHLKRQLNRIQYEPPEPLPNFKDWNRVAEPGSRFANSAINVWKAARIYPKEGCTKRLEPSTDSFYDEWLEKQDVPFRVRSLPPLKGKPPRPEPPPVSLTPIEIQISEMLHEIDHLNEGLSRRHKEIDVANQTLQQLRASTSVQEVEALERKLRVATTYFNAKDKKVKIMKKEKAEASKLFKEELKEEKSKKRGYAETMITMEEVLTELRQENEQLKEEIRLLKERNSEQEAEIKKKEKLWEAKQWMMDKLNQDQKNSYHMVERLNNQIYELTNQVRDLTKQLEDSKEENGRLTRELDESDRQRTRMEKEILRHQGTMVEPGLGAMRRQLKTLNLNLERERRSAIKYLYYKDLTRKLQSMRAKEVNTFAQDRINELGEQNHRLQEQNRILKNENATLQKRDVKHQVEIERLRKENYAWRKDRSARFPVPSSFKRVSPLTRMAKRMLGVTTKARGYWQMYKDQCQVVDDVKTQLHQVEKQKEILGKGYEDFLRQRYDGPLALIPAQDQVLSSQGFQEGTVDFTLIPTHPSMLMQPQAYKGRVEMAFDPYQQLNVEAQETDYAGALLEGRFIKPHLGDQFQGNHFPLIEYRVPSAANQPSAREDAMESAPLYEEPLEMMQPEESSMIAWDYASTFPSYKLALAQYEEGSTSEIRD